MITHTVFFTLKHAEGSAEVKKFFAAAQELAKIPGVEHFVCLKQISPKNNFDFGLSMEFASQELCDSYTNHPDHTRFVKQYWGSNVADFIEIDYQLL